MPKPTIVLTHGGFVDGSGWRNLFDLLRSEGYGVAVTQHSTATYDGDVAAVKAVIDAQPGSVVLVGHSYGGAVITGAGLDDKVAALVYVTAFAPDAGESVMDLIQGFPQDGPQPPILPPQDGNLLLDIDKMPAAFAADVPEGDAVFMAHSQLPWGVAAASAKIDDPAWRKKPTWYLVATDDHMIPPAAQRKMAARTGAKVSEAPGPHAIFMSHPDEVARVVLAAASSIEA